MFWANRLNRITGIVLLLLPILSIAGFIAAAPIGELDPFSRGEIVMLLTAINGNFWLFITSLVPFVITDVIVLPAIGILIFLIFKDRSHFLALLCTFGFIVAAGAFIIHEVGAMILPFLATDFLVEGGANGIAVGNPIILEIGRTISIMQAMAALFGQTAMGLGITSISALIIWAPKGDRNPPRFLGILGIIAGVGNIVTWSFLLNHIVGGVATLVAETATIFMVFILGVWLLRQPEISISK